jgi:hypothetical protein
MAIGSHKLSDDDYRKLGKALEKIVRKDYVDLALNWKRLVGVSLLRGLAVGFGTVLGATILIALLVWLLSLFDQLPFVGNLFENVRQTIDEAR